MIVGVVVGVLVEVPVAVGSGVLVDVGVKVGLSVAVGTGVDVRVTVLVGTTASMGMLVLVGINVGTAVGVETLVGVFAGVAVMTSTTGAGVGWNDAMNRRISSVETIPATVGNTIIAAIISNPHSTILPQPPPFSLTEEVLVVERLLVPPSEVSVAVERERLLPSLQATQVHAGGWFPSP